MLAVRTATAGSAGLIGIDGLTLSGTNIAVEANSASDPLGPVADFSGTHNLDLATGPDSSITLDADGSLGPLLRASGHLKLDVFGFVQAEGDLALQKSSGEVKLGVAMAVLGGPFFFALLLSLRRRIA